MEEAIIICSGGLDSVVTAHYVKKLGYRKLNVVFFNYGQRSLKAERECAKKCTKNVNAFFKEIKLKELSTISGSLINKGGFVNRLSRMDLKNTGRESQKFYVPFRNGIFLSYAIAFADSLFAKNKSKCDIFVGFKNEGKEFYPDTTKKFVKAINKIAEATESKPRIIAPLINKDKEDIILLGKKLGVNLGHTHSCYFSNKACGKCLACMLRKEGFYWANIEDPTFYN